MSAADKYCRYVIQVIGSMPMELLNAIRRKGHPL
jgi:hypothetical protein